MQLVCPECKNDVNLSCYPHLNLEQILECDICGITLMVNKMDDGNVETEVVDEGK